MRPATTLLLAVTLLATSLAGCIGDEGGDPATANSDPGLPGVDVEIPDLSGQLARDFIESYVMTHPFRSVNPAYQPYMDQAREDLEAELGAMGHTVERHAYDGGVNILAIQEGTTNPEQWVVLSAHYDTVDVGVGTTVYGAWDDGSGVGALLALAEGLVETPFPFTVVYAFFDGEEKGLVGSGQFVETYLEQVDLVANLNMDPPGLNWPCGDELGPFPVKIIHEMDKVQNSDLPRYTWLHDAIEAGLAAAGVPDEHRDYTPGIPIAGVANQGITGTSDHARFGAVDVANVFIGGIPTTIVNGDANDYTAAALTYPLHTPLDTLEAMEARCTQGSLADGLQTTVTVVGEALGEMARQGVPG